MIRSVAVIGVGAMGAPMAMNIRKAGFDLTVCDRSEAARAPFAALGVRCVTRAADCAGCDAVIVLVATPEQARAVVLGEGGLREGLDGRTPMLVVMGTLAPETMRALAQELEPTGVPVVDAPVSGGAVKARDGSLAIIMGGREEDCAALRPLMAAMGSAIFHCGPLGAGQATKIVNNLVGITTLMVAAEAYRIAGANGIRLPDAIPVFEAGTGRNFFTSQAKDAPEAYGTWTATRADFDSLQAILRKDIDLALTIGEASGPLPFTRALRVVLDGVDDETFQTWRAVASAPRQS
ncbi:NAD(P)-dependent oxidoreductase [Xanthobacter dioxanivorans]|uniref:NAD(P)-dependent oxidoreductase n=1 Tax=Xanthobacter dioxanivorans TaxID=2528964 RepID=A0A974PTP8_9HYPH|nr:NAD(P)-dependent oxidoreductase [Xanthobacter dioxanivorans]QRG09063.1 NAD(P)-dependent oxidoreductase [Xanthobacter dioxanivorans]